MEWSFSLPFLRSRAGAFYNHDGLWNIIQNEKFVWKLFYITPSAIIASLSLVFIGISAFREPLFNTLKWPILIVFFIYAYIQIPAYILYFAFSTHDLESLPEYKAAIEEGIHAITLFAVSGKCMFIVIFIGLLVNITDINQMKRFVAITNMIVGLFSIGFALLVLFYRVVTVISLVK